MVPFAPLNDGSNKHRQEAESSATARPGSPPTAGRSRGPGGRIELPGRPLLRQGREEVTLTVGQTFIQVLTSARRSRSRTASCQGGRAADADHVAHAGSGVRRRPARRPAGSPRRPRPRSDARPLSCAPRRRPARAPADRSRRSAARPPAVQARAARRGYPPTRRAPAARRRPTPRPGSRTPALRRGEAGSLGQDRQDRGAGAADERRQRRRRGGPARRPGHRRRATRRRPRERRTVVRACARRAAPAAATGSGGAIGGRPAAASSASAPQERREVLAGVVPPGEDEVALGQAEPLALRGTSRHPRRRNASPRGERHDPDASRRNAEAAGPLRRRHRADDDRDGVAQQSRAESLPEARRQRALEGAGHLPRREVEERRHDRQPRRERQRAATGRVVDGPGGTAPLRPPRRPERRAAQEERVDGHPAERSSRWGAAAADRRRRGARSASVGSSRSDRRKNANDSPASGSASKAPSSPPR